MESMNASWNQRITHNRGRNPARIARQETLQAILFLIVALLIFFWPAVFGGRVLLPANLIRSSLAVLPLEGFRPRDWPW
jgi:hypothetical protein